MIDMFLYNEMHLKCCLPNGGRFVSAFPSSYEKDVLQHSR